ncbi:MAG: hypothetical protein ACRD2P_01175 [Terriglobia bacterium]
MLGFRKKVTVQSFWQSRLEGTFSGKNEPGWDALKASFHDPALDAVEPLAFYTHIQAMTIETVSIVISKRCSMEVSSSSILFVSEFLRKRNRVDVENLLARYSSAFGSSFTDGIRPMVEFFSREVSGSALAPSTVEGLHRTLYLLVQEVRNLLRSTKLVALPRDAEKPLTSACRGPLAWLDVTRLPGVTRDRDGALQLGFTDGEKEAVKREFDQFKGPEGEPYLAHPQVHDELENALTARGLWFYADRQIQRSQLAEPRTPELLNNAAAALVKAYCKYPLPTFLGYLGLLLKKMGEPVRADRAFAEWRESQGTFKRSQVAKATEESIVACSYWEG